MNELIALAVDPGVTTGFAFGRIQTTTGCMSVITGQEKMTVPQFYNWLKEIEPDFIVYESFEFRNSARKGLELYSRELIGIIELYGDQSSCGLFKQSPGTVLNAYYNHKRLKADNLYKPNGIHANEACMHLLHWYTFGFGYQFNKEGYKPA